MQRKYAIYTGSDGEREVIVINGQPYYRSTGKNSNMPGMWLPFVACVGSSQLDLERYVPGFTREYTYANYGSGYGYIIKKSLLNAKAAEQDTSGWCLFALTQEISVSSFDTEDEKKAEVAEFSSNLALQNLSERLYLKEDLINSLKLSKHPWQKYFSDLKTTGLDIKQQESIKTHFILEDKPELITDSPDEINNWLIKNGASYISQMIRTFPTSYNTIWNEVGKDYQSRIDSLRQRIKMRYSVEEDNLKKNMQLEQTIAILSDYTKNNSRIKRFFTGHWNRHHTKLIKECLEKKPNHPLKLIADIRCSLGKNLKLDGSLEKRLTFIEQQLIVDKNQASIAILLYRQSQEEHKQKPACFTSNMTNEL